MIRRAKLEDIPEIAETYTELLTYEKEHGSHSNWKLGVYPTVQAPEKAVPEGTMYVLEDGAICASMILNQEQAPEYESINWLYPAEKSDVLVIHTLCIPPSRAGRGYGRKMVSFAKELAAKNGCAVIRIDTYARNKPAKRLYQKCGFRISGYGPTLLQRLIQEDQVYLEYQAA